MHARKRKEALRGLAPVRFRLPGRSVAKTGPRLPGRSEAKAGPRNPLECWSDGVMGVGQHAPVQGPNACEKFTGGLPMNRRRS
jgi:hypothetical protein